MTEAAVLASLTLAVAARAMSAVPRSCTSRQDQGQAIGAVDATQVGRLAVVLAISVPACAVWPAELTDSAAVVDTAASWAPGGPEHPRLA